jgi:hypothetical protein
MALNDLNGPMIAPGETLSGPLDCCGGTILRVTMPSQWTAANLSFQVATAAEGPWGDLFDVDGKELVVPVRAGATVMLKNQPPGALLSLAFISFRSGRRGRPIAQEGGAPRIFVTTIDDGKGPAEETPPVATAPSVVDAPSVTMGGNVVASCDVGSTLACTLGNWNGEPTDYWQSWLADSAVVGSGNSYTVQGGDAGKTICCSVTATNAAGSGNALSNSVTVAALGDRQ